MHRIALAAAAALLLLASSATAQTTGTSLVERIRDDVRHDYRYSLTEQGRLLTLTDRVHNAVRGHVYLGDRGILHLSAPVADLAGSPNRLVALKSACTDLNTRLPVGTLVIDDHGVVTLEHTIGVPVARFDDMVVAVRMVMEEAERLGRVLVG